MEIVLFIIMSIFISLGIETINELSIFKEIASLGYKLDLSKIDKYIDKKDNNKWLFRTTVGAVITGLIAIVLTFIK